MKKVYRLLLLVTVMCFAVTTTFSQGVLKGSVLDAKTNESLIGATIMVIGSSTGTSSGLDGSFSLKVQKTEADIIVSYVGYISKTLTVKIKGEVNLGKIALETNALGLEGVQVISSIAIERQTPVAVSSIKADVIEKKVGNQEFPEILRTTPSVYVTRSGGGFGDSRINVRGFDQRNTAIMINGIPVNDMENGWVYWSNWAGLSDATRDLQVQRGLGASKLAISSVGGTMNIITKTTDAKKGGVFASSVGNDGYLKNALTLSTGRMKGGWAITVAGSRTTGDGYIDQTWTDAWSYFGSITKEFNKKHMLVLTAVGAPQQHGQRSTQETIKKYDSYGKKYNSDWGYLNGNEYTMRKNFYHKPQYALNHYWTISDKSFLATSVYASFGRGGGSGDIGNLAWKDAKDKTNKVYLSSFRNSKDHTLLIDSIYKYNSGGSFTYHFKNALGNDTVITFSNTADSDGKYKAGIIRRASMNEHNWYGFLSTLKHTFNDNLKLVAGVDLRYYKGLHYQKVYGLLGADYYLDINTDKNHPIVKAEADDKIGYDYDSQVYWEGAFAQLEYSKNNLSVFVAGSVSNTSFKRVDRFSYYSDANIKAIAETMTVPITIDKITYNDASDLLARYPGQESPTKSYVGYTVKGGINYNINEYNNIFFNTGYFTRPPTLGNIFVNYKNDLASDIKNEKVFSMELGYGLNWKFISANVNLYSTQWIDKAFQQSWTSPSGLVLIANITGQNALHNGIEIDINAEPVKDFKLSAMASIGDWQWKNDVTARIFDENHNPVSTVNVYANDIRVGDAAQTTFAFGADYKFRFGLGFDATYSYYTNNYAKFDPSARQNENDRGQSAKLDPYGLLDAGISYTYRMEKIGFTFRINANNLLDEVYIADATDVPVLEDGTYSHDIDNAKGWYGFGRTWNASIRIDF
ncbi:MAG: TonB-dependent receptor [Lentimicrobiaceae bacterium]|nr:TonB-dependent receptor [Lentimicrobiaceae bacterium]